MSSAREGGEGLVLLDACVLINLFATGRAEEILDALPYRFAVARYVAEEEVLEIDATSEGDEDRPVEAEREGRIGLRPGIQALVEKGNVEQLDVSSPEEHRQLVRFAAHLDDGEAHTCALAFARSARVATDDRKAIRIFGEARRAADPPEGAGAPCLRTSELLFEWAEASRADRVELGRIVRNIARRASFLPPRNDPHAERWLKLLRLG